MLQHIRRRRRPFQAFLAATLLAGCSVGPDFRGPNPPAGPATPALPRATVSSKTTGGTPQIFAEGRDIPGEWWTLFGSRQIESMVQQALRANPDLPAAQATLREAATAISVNPDGNLVYIVHQDGVGKDGKPNLVVRQQFVTTGDARGDQVAVTKGLQAGDQVVIANQLKLRNNIPVLVNNSVLPANDAAPTPADQ